MPDIKNIPPRKMQIEKEATKLFEKNGFSATSMRGLANELRIEAASLYSHIKSKDEILQSICFKIADNFFNAIDGLSNNAQATANKLEAYIKAHVEVITNNPSAAAVFFSEWRHLTEPSLSRFLKMRQEYEKRFLDLLEEGIEKKEFTIADPKFTVRMLLSSINWIHTWYSPGGDLTSEEIAKNLADIFLNGIKMQPR